MSVESTESSTLNANPMATQRQSRERVLWMQFFAIASLIIVAVGVGWIYLGPATRDEGPRLTHTIERGNLVVTVTEQGTLESSDNTEIKCRVRGWSTVTEIVPSGTMVKPGDVLVKLDTKRVEDAISLHTTDTHTAQATLERSRANVAAAEIAEAAYLEGRYKSQKQSLERSYEIADANLKSATKMFEHSKEMFRRGYISEQEVIGNRFTVRQAQLELEIVETQLFVLDEYTKKMELETIRGNLLSSNSKLQADLSGFAMDDGRRKAALAELDHCEILAEKAGMVIYPSVAAWKDTPDVTEGAGVRRDQVLLLMPDLTQMQVKVGIHESMIDRIRTGQRAVMTLSEGKLIGSVKHVASVARPAGWWTGNLVKYDTVIDIPKDSDLDLKPGMSAQVEVVLAEYADVLTVPVAAVVETENETLCWVKKNNGVERRSVLLGDGNDVFIVVQEGLQEGDQVVLNPRAVVEDAKKEVLKTIDETESESQILSSEISRTELRESNSIFLGSGSLILL